MLALKGTIQGNTVVLDDKEFNGYDGREAIITILDYPYKRKKNKIDLKKYMGKGEKLFHSDAQEYIREMRDNDRI